MTDIDIDRYLENGSVTLEQLNHLLVAGLAQRHHATLEEMVNELIRDGIRARATRHARDHRCKRGETNKRFCAVCSKPMEGTT